MTQRPKAKPTSLTKLGRLGGEPSTLSVPWVMSLLPPIMSRWIVASVRLANSGRALSRAIVHSTSHGQMKRIVRCGLRQLAAPRPAGCRRPRHLEDAGAAAGIVVRARRRVVEVAGEDDLVRRGRLPGMIAVGIR